MLLPSYKQPDMLRIFRSCLLENIKDDTESRSTDLTGYGPRSRLYFDGNETHYELWEVKFLGYIKLQKLLDVIVKPAGERQEDAPTCDKLSEAFANLYSSWMTGVWA